MKEFSEELRSWLRPVATASNDGKEFDPMAYSRRIDAIIGRYKLQESKKDHDEARAEAERQRLFGALAPAFEKIEHEFKRAGMSDVSNSGPRQGVDPFVQMIGGTDYDPRRWNWQFSVQAALRTEARITTLIAGVLIGLGVGPDGRHDLDTPISVVAGYALDMEARRNNEWTNTLKDIIWRMEARFVLGQPRETETVAELKSALLQNLPTAFDRLVEVAEADAT
jgi:hypothetical protein